MKHIKIFEFTFVSTNEMEEEINTWLEDNSHKIEIITTNVVQRGYTTQYFILYKDV